MPSFFKPSTTLPLTQARVPRQKKNLATFVPPPSLYQAPLSKLFYASLLALEDHPAEKQQLALPLERISRSRPQDLLQLSVS
ncbi:hypothetical protein M5K25_004479 [Dendrobium thyrsiflorum]|uniref:Uncharacterized protein n=1 Tax=Dendrobium thyrsiflorum TaxID=117978 RepID=A0ABD0VN68_DENTH